LPACIYPPDEKVRDNTGNAFEKKLKLLKNSVNATPKFTIFPPKEEGLGRLQMVKSGFALE
jgi:hypothetical protein